MSPWEKLSRNPFLIKLRSWEYWPFGIVHAPAIFYWLWLSLRARSLVFFSASNPGIPMGGMFGESKFDVLQMIPGEYVPQTLLIEANEARREVMHRMQEAGMDFPVIFKPDLGERGFMVRRISNEDEVDIYLSEMKNRFLVQELVDLPCEFGVYYAHHPGHARGRVISLVEKEMLAVTGDGVSTLKQLILRKDRAKLQWQKLEVAYRDRLEDIPAAGEKIELVSIGNHALGTRFINANHLINERLSETFNSISSQVRGFYFGRYDLRCASLEDLYSGKVKILELNGCGAEPGHIYDSEFPLWKALIELTKHWRHIYEIARANKKRGVDYISHREAFIFYRKFKSAVR